MYEKLLEIITEIMSKSTFGLCQLRYLLVISLLQLDRNDEAYNVSKFFLEKKDDNEEEESEGDVENIEEGGKDNENLDNKSDGQEIVCHGKFAKRLRNLQPGKFLDIFPNEDKLEMELSKNSGPEG